MRSCEIRLLNRLLRKKLLMKLLMVKVLVQRDERGFGSLLLLGFKLFTWKANVLVILKQQNIIAMMTGAKANVAEARMKEFMMSVIGSKCGVLVVTLGGTRFMEKQMFR